MISVPKQNRLQLQREGDYDISLTRWGPDYGYPTTYLNLLLTGASNNIGSYSNTEYDRIVREAMVETDSTKSWAMLQKAEGIVLNDVPVAPMFQVRGASLINPKVKGIETHAVGEPFIYKNVTIE